MVCIISRRSTRSHSRTLNLIEKFFSGKMPAALLTDPASTALKDQTLSTSALVRRDVEALAPDQAIGHVVELLTAANRYMEERAEWVQWRGIRIQNWHRPLGTYMTLLLEQNLELRHFSEPMPVGGEPEKAAWHRRVPYFLMMEWQKSARAA